MNKIFVFMLLSTFSLATLAEEYMVLNVAGTWNDNPINLIDAKGIGLGVIDCEKWRYSYGPVQDVVSSLMNTDKGSVSVNLSNDEGKVLIKQEKFYFQDTKSCKEALRQISEHASAENPVSLVLVKGIPNGKIFISKKF